MREVPKGKLPHPLLKKLESSGLSRLRSGHAWLRKKDIKDIHFFPKISSLVHLGEHWFLWDPESFLSLRRIGPSLRDWLYSDSDKGLKYRKLSNSEGFEFLLPWLEQHLSRLWEIKQARVDEEKCFRWVFSDADFLPGLIVDCFESTLVVDLRHPFWTENFVKLSQLLLKLGTDVLGKNFEIVELKSKVSPRRWMRWNGFEWFVAPGESQKTGSYLDQKHNHLRAARWAQKLKIKTAWDICSFEGGFSLHLARQGIQVLAVDQSESALEVLAKNAEKNGLKSGIETQHEDMFRFLREKFNEKAKVGAIVLDPPSLVKSQHEVEGASRGLKEMVLRSLHCLEPGGLLVLCTCSYHLTSERVLQLVREAAHDSRVELQLLEKGQAYADHASLMSVPETDYLNAYFLQKLG